MPRAILMLIAFYFSLTNSLFVGQLIDNSKCNAFSDDPFFNTKIVQVNNLKSLHGIISTKKELSAIKNTGKALHYDFNKKGELKIALLSIVVTRDNIGEALWFIYTGILLITIINYNMTVRGCKLSPEMQAKRGEEFRKKEEEAEKQRELEDKTVYLG